MKIKGVYVSANYCYAFSEITRSHAIGCRYGADGIKPFDVSVNLIYGKSGIITGEKVNIYGKYINLNWVQIVS